MGSVMGVKDPYEYSISTDDGGQMEINRGKALTPLTINTGTAVRPTILEVPCYTRHPFQEYQFNKKLGDGAFSVVYKGISVSDSKKKVAIKEIDVSKLTQQQIADVTVEMNILSQLKHPSVVRLFSVYIQNDKKFLIMEYLKGGQLLNAICKRDHYTEGDARRLLLQIASALQYLHSRRVVHRDLKPENLILENASSLESNVKLVDFGFAQVETELTLRQPSRVLCGTPGYMAPEILRDKSYSAQVDMWSLGVVVYVLLSGTLPFVPDNDLQVMSGSYSFPDVRWRSVSRQAKDLIAKLLVVDPTRRLTAAEVLSHSWMRQSNAAARRSNATNSNSRSISPSAQSDESSSPYHAHAGSNGGPSLMGQPAAVGEDSLTAGLSDCPGASEGPPPDVDISENLESLRQHAAAHKFNVNTLFSRIRWGSSGGRSSAALGTPPYSPSSVSDSPAAQDEKMARQAGSAVADSNGAAVSGGPTAIMSLDRLDALPH